MSSQPKYTQPIFRLNQPDDSDKIQQLPAPSGTYPYRLEAAKVVGLPEDKFSFHMVGDTGGMRYPEGQRLVVEQMCGQIEGVPKGEAPAFLYHLGDVVYHYGEAENYDRQFFKPYADYPGPIFAIAGNHDTDVNPFVAPYESLDAFTAVFCDAERRDVAFSKSKNRKSMVQPNVYWTLKTPLANFIGLHSNATKFGYVDNEQRKWFVEELKTAAGERPGKAIIVCVHHAPYSADFNHGSSLYMINMLEEAFDESGIRPDIILSGHVHNYQRFHKIYPDGKMLPFIVCGAGGYDELHDLAPFDDTEYTPHSPVLECVTMQKAVVMKHGFLNITLERKGEGVQISGDYYIVPEPGVEQTLLMDSFKYVIYE
ncbi:metallophosphoesterase [Flavobacterium akiainvivens]|uniref:Metallophosphoesterase n=1 Tax=Flavobacterium akiainvivens TaxID=1202724 RepID=A0A0M8MBA7_9FLAO|nr:metallophosphoesterase [Flavobacterium akiainvivens]KOS06505.1 metallophosphoesterase [Flavobacterium akiainvivens]SFQ11861.1 Calcineurin-like phosphoesterase [Flavobacterium akiainvivens]